MKRTVKKRRAKIKGTASIPVPQKRGGSNPGHTLLLSIIISAAYIICMLVIIKVSHKEPLPAAPAAVPATDAAYRNPELAKMKNLKTGGTIEKRLPVVDRLKFTMSDAPLFDGADPVYSLTVCCQGGTPREYYTCKMPWAFIMYEYESGVPTVTVFEIRSGSKTGRYEIIVMDPRADIAAIKAVSVTIYEELLRQYMPGYEWKGSVRQEIN